MILGLCLAVAVATAADDRDAGDKGAACRAGLVDVMQRFGEDDRLLQSFFPIATAESRARRRERVAQARAALDALDVSLLPTAGKVDLHLFQNDLARIDARLVWEEQDAEAAAPLLDAVEVATRLERIDRLGDANARWRTRPLARAEPVMPESPDGDARELARQLGRVTAAAKAARAAGTPEQQAALAQPAAVRFAVARLREARSFLDAWHRRDAPADPVLAFWTETPVKEATRALDEVVNWLDGEVLEGLKKKPTGSPFAIGRERYIEELRFEGIAISPEEMLAFGTEQLAALQGEMLRELEKLAAAGKGKVDATRLDWKQALDVAKEELVPVGGQKQFVDEVANEAIRACKEWQLFPVPELAEECWRVKLSDVETQKSYAYGFYGNNFMGASSPLPEMDHERKLECLRSNARPFTRTVVPHELIPGHHLQRFYSDRFEPQRERFSSPFYGEGWAVHCEQTLDEHGFFRTPQERIGHLFWRLLRAARIVASTKYHLRQMTQAEMVDYMVENAGLERSAAEAEVGRYMTYSPLYQCAYLYGCHQIRELLGDCRKAWGTGFSELRFNTAVLEQSSMPIRFLREALLGTP